MKKKFLFILLLALTPFNLFLVKSALAVEENTSSGRILATFPQVESKIAPNRILVRLNKPVKVVHEKDVSFSAPLVGQKIVLQNEGFAVKGMEEITKLNKDLNAQSVRRLGNNLKSLKETLLISFDEDVDLDRVLVKYSQAEGVLFVEPDYLVQTLWVPDDPYFSNDPINYYQWNFARIRMPEAWDIQPRGGDPEIKVAIVDSGAAFKDVKINGQQFAKAPELDGVNFESPYQHMSIEYCDSDCNCTLRDTPLVNDLPCDDSGHGTHVSSTIVQMTDNASHAAGVAFNTTIIPIKTFYPCGGTAVATISDVIAGIDYAVEKRADVLNLSVGLSDNSSALHDAIIDAFNQGVVIVAASGNQASRSSSPAITYPAAYPETIAVGATRWDNRRAFYSNYGPELDLVAPGGQVVTDASDNFLDQNNDTLPDGIVQQTIKPDNFTQFTSVGEIGGLGFRCVYYDGMYYRIDLDCGLYNGTSMATPHVSAAAVLVLSVNSSLTPSQVKDILVTTANSGAIPDYSQSRHGAGLLDVVAALNEAEIDYKKGDINLDGVVNFEDARVGLRLYRQTDWIDQYSPDPDGDGKVTMFDLGYVIRDWGS